MKAATSTAIVLLCIALALPAAYSQDCATGLIRVCVTPLLCLCVLPGGGAGDPILRDFAGNKFEFFGEPESFYNIYSDKAQQVNMKLFPGFVDGHNGTYIGAFGFAFHDYRVNVTLLSDGDMSVEAWQELPSNTVAPKHSVLVSGETSFITVGKKDGNTLTVSTEPFRPYHGRSVDIVSGTLELNMWAVPPGLLDSHNVSQPAYLNFNLTLLAPPAGDAVEGIIGESLGKAVEHHKQRRDNLFAESLTHTPLQTSEDIGVFEGKGLTNDYRVEGLFGTDFAFNQFGETQTITKVARRSLMASRFNGLAFPLHSTSL